jgi:hypothetical protein
LLKYANDIDHLTVDNNKNIAHTKPFPIKKESPVEYREKLENNNIPRGMGEPILDESMKQKSFLCINICIYMF